MITELPEVRIILAMENSSCPEAGFRIGCQVADGVQLDLGDYILHKVKSALGGITLATDLNEVQADVNERVEHLLLELLSGGYLKSTHYRYGHPISGVKWYFNSPDMDKPFKHLRDAPSAISRPVYSSTYLPKLELPPLHPSCRCETSPLVTKGMMEESFKEIAKAGKSASKAFGEFGVSVGKVAKEIASSGALFEDDVLDALAHVTEFHKTMSFDSTPSSTHTNEEDDEWELDDGAYDGLEYEDDSEKGPDQ